MPVLLSVEARRFRGHHTVPGWCGVLLYCGHCHILIARRRTNEGPQLRWTVCLTSSDRRCFNLYDPGGWDDEGVVHR